MTVTLRALDPIPAEKSKTPFMVRAELVTADPRNPRRQTVFLFGGRDWNRDPSDPSLLTLEIP